MLLYVVYSNKFDKNNVHCMGRILYGAAEFGVLQAASLDHFPLMNIEMMNAIHPFVINIKIKRCLVI